MLRPLTLRMADETNDRIYMFTFYCDLCGKPWKSVATAGATPFGEGQDSKEFRQREHEAAFERANLEAMRHFNRCSKCKRWVCDDCLLLLEEGDICKECTSKEHR